MAERRACGDGVVGSLLRCVSNPETGLSAHITWSFRPCGGRRVDHFLHHSRNPASGRDPSVPLVSATKNVTRAHPMPRYFAIIAWVWSSQIRYDVRYEANDGYHRIMKAFQLGTFAYIGAGSGNWNTEILYSGPAATAAESECRQICSP